MSTPRYSSVEDFLESLAADKQHTLRTVIDLVLGEFPDLESKVAWNTPQIHRGSDYVFGVSSLTSHLALAPWSTDVIEEFRPRLEGNGYVVKKHLFQVPDDWDVDDALITGMVRARLAELDDPAEG